ncbi:MAG: prepilin-type N-terminal cleavage/methylation domain-containing protein [Deltaproteobacteria bacterium]|nr:prepilin-type N-terminal cleavage/methylation domain-containing protein [Deltaproteobacteria bacterium]MBI3061533.1 prepilin-type N-terminal cleavage/methylation domain-containing protein [Deltaproteobacteria bacterium]
MRTRDSQLKTRSGFTLIEVAISITLLALIAVILYGAFYLSHRAVAKSQARSEESQRLRSAGDLLAGYIRSAYPYRMSREDLSIRFFGQEDSLTFVSALSSGMGGRGMAEVTIFWESEGEEGGLLGLQERIPVALAGGEEGGGYRNSLLLDRGVRGLRLEYLDPQGEEERWVDQWSGTEKRMLPRAVRLRYQGERGEEIEWVFPIMMSVLAP